MFCGGKGEGNEFVVLKDLGVTAGKAEVNEVGVV